MWMTTPTGSKSALRHAGVDGILFQQDVFKLGALTTPAQEGSHPPRQTSGMIMLASFLRRML